ncbi:DEAD/DEAH box helicase [Chryseobacterium jejuense]|uniref:DEAD/DEAH box helicase n=1 Tax=Chryseobacterium jejuense TaxID=445960 RepID=UPI001AE1A599|nr:ATP-binding domain-containing protein [Chryseobacterium jejuense]MBP2617855.1 superfamily I DNA and RNA helicase [Chryseobacterium jejuense]
MFLGDPSKLDNDLIAKIVIDKIESLNIDNSFTYHNFPLYRGEVKDDIINAHVLFVSQEFGVIFFRCFEEKIELNQNELLKLDELDSHILAKISRASELRNGRRDLKINVTPKLFLNDNIDLEGEDYVKIANINEVIQSNKKETLSDENFSILTSTIEGSYRLNSKKERTISESNPKENTKGKILNIIQNQITSFDFEQKRAALNNIESPQRIRGLAGSGKTIILTMKAALYHIEHPEEDILYTYYTKALYGNIKYLIEKYYNEFSEYGSPNWDKIHILHGWGGKGVKGVYSTITEDNNITPISFIDAKIKNSKNPFEFLFDKLDTESLKIKYGLSLIDEGQDFPQSFYRVVRKITNKSRIVWAYDDFQNIFDVKIQDEKETFGKDENENYYVDFSRDQNSLQDIVLHKCYRTPRILLLNAFALGLGIYNNPVLQRLEDNDHWIDLGFEVETGDSKTNSEMVISRPEKNSPIITNELFKENAISLKIFDNIREECQYVAELIYKDITEEELNPEDISVIGIDGKHISGYFENITNILSERGINCFNHLNAPYNNKIYSKEGLVTLSTLNKAKGNESGMVYIVGTEYAFINKNYIIDRNKIFTAITRSKGWVVMTGFEKAQQCQLEMDLLKENKYKFKFTQPSGTSTRMILRGMTKQQSILNEINIRVQELSKIGLTEAQIMELIKELNTKK